MRRTKNEHETPPKTSNQTLSRRLGDMILRRGMSRKTQRAYLYWLHRYLAFHGDEHPSQLDTDAVKLFISHVVTERELATASKHQAIAALKFLYAQVLPSIAVEADSFSRDCEAYQAPSVLTRAEISAVLARLSGIPRIVAMLLYGSGMRLSECLNLRIQDVNEREDTIYIRAAHGNDERVTLLPARIKTALVHHIRQTALVHQQDLLTPRGGWVALPTGITTQARSAGRHWLWQWVFPASRTHIHQPSQQCRRHHLSEHVIHLAVDEAAREAGITKQVSAHTLRHSFATHLLMHGSDMRSIQSLLGHKHLRTTTNYVRAAKLLRCRIRSPLDSFCDINGDSESE